MKKILITYLFCLLPLVVSGEQGHLAMNTGGNTGGGATVAAPGGGCELLDFDAEAYADGDNMGSVAVGWSGADDDYIEIDDTYAHGGTKSIKVVNRTSSSDVYKTITSQDGKEVTIKFWLRLDDQLGDGEIDYLIDLSDASKTNYLARLKLEGNAATTDLDYLDSTDTYQSVLDDITVDTWYFVVVELDLTNDKQQIWMDTTDSSPTKRLATADLAESTSGQPFDEMHIDNDGNSNQVIFTSIDDICIEAGSYD